MIAPSDSSRGATPYRCYIGLCLLWLVLFGISITGYPNLMDNEHRIGAYATDILQNGNWIAQHDSSGQFISKPPGMTWLVVLCSFLTGGLSRFSLYLPSALATLGVALLVFHAGRKFFGIRSGMFAALMYLLSYVADKQLTTARYDGLFALPVTLGALAAFHGWKEGRGWFVFWVAMTFGAMVKGPLVFVLAGVGLIAALWEKNAGHLFKWKWQHAAGIALFALVCGGWLALVLKYHGEEFSGKIIHRELMGQALNDGGKHAFGSRLWQAPFDFLQHFLPWSICGVAAIILAIRGGREKETTSFQRFLICWVVVGLCVFALAAHQRGRLIWPLIPVFALLGGHQLSEWLRRFDNRVVYRWTAAFPVLFLVGITLLHHVFLGRSTDVKQTLAMRSLAETLRAKLGDKPEVTYVSAPFAVQFHLGYLRFGTNAVRGAELLNHTNPAYVLVGERDIRRLREGVTNEMHSLYVWPSARNPKVELLSNRPDFDHVHPGIVRLGTIGEPALKEASGLAASFRHAEVFWTHNDSGNRPLLYAINRHGEVLGSWTVTGARLLDWEGVSADAVGNLYLADTGDNATKRSTVAIHQVREPNPQLGGGTLPVQRSWILRYPDSPRNCESLVIVRTNVFLVSKRKGIAAEVFQFSLTDTNPVITLKLVGPTTITTPVTDAAISPDGRTMAMISSAGVFAYRIDNEPCRIVGAQPLHIPFRNRRIEGCTFVPDGLLAVAETRELFLITNTLFADQNALSTPAVSFDSSNAIRGEAQFSLRN